MVENISMEPFWKSSKICSFLVCSKKRLYETCVVNCFLRWLYCARCGRGHVSPVERWDVDGGVWPRVHPIHAGIRFGRYSVQHSGLCHHVLHCTRLCQGSDARSGYCAHRGWGFLKYGPCLETSLIKMHALFEGSTLPKSKLVPSDLQKTVDNRIAVQLIPSLSLK